jgi:rSAM/selenodomain-associated transferase 1
MAEPVVMRCTLIIFVKAPRRGAVKRRLGAAIGMGSARRFYHLATNALLRRVGRDPRWRAVLAVAPDAFARSGRFWPAGLAREPQRSGGLGARMARALHRHASQGPAVLVGSDIPDLGAGQVWQAFRALGRHDLVFGPATDGGYWLVGTRRKPDRNLFARVRWSSPHALADTLANVRPGRRVALLAPLSDVDDGAAYRALAVRRVSDARSGGA